MTKKDLLNALYAINPVDLDYSDWLRVGIALKNEGCTAADWDEWSKLDEERYHPGECETKWDTFGVSENPVTGATIFKLARDAGNIPQSNDSMDWDDEISNDGGDALPPVAPPSSSASQSPSDQLIAFLEANYARGDVVGYVTTDVHQDQDGKFKPGRGVFSRTCGELIAELQQNPNDIGAVIGDWKDEAGAWIHINALDGKGVSDANVTRYANTLVECDELSVDDQERLYRELKLPIRSIVYSGGKSMHAVVKIDARNRAEYDRRVKHLYDFLAKHGVPIDRQNSNPSRMTRLPGVTRNRKYQTLVATNIGVGSWEEWENYADSLDSDLPAAVALSEYDNNLPSLPKELIGGILREGHKMLIAGPSKAGKSFLLMQLAIAIAEGLSWLGFQCAQGVVFYINLEIDGASAIHRFFEIYEALGIPKNSLSNIIIWNLRGHAVPLDKLVPFIIDKIKHCGKYISAVIIDPIYKVLTGDENSATDMSFFTNQFDIVCKETGAACIYCHHHSKGAQGGKRAQDRSSGSGVFARDPDAVLDIIELKLTPDLKNNVADEHATAWRMESSLREFPNFFPVDFWFEHPLHRLDTSGELANANPEGSPKNNLMLSSRFSTSSQRENKLDTAYDACNTNGIVTVTDLSQYEGVSDRTIRNWLKERPNDYTCTNGVVIRKPKDNVSK